MTPDEQFELLVERQEALTRTVELLAREMRGGKRPETEKPGAAEDGDRGNPTGAF